jgi:hypothetical protein
MHRIIILLLLSFSAYSLSAQELNGRVNVLSNRVANNVDKNSFQTLQTALIDFVNNRKWTNDVFAQKEKIDCSFLLNLESTGDANVYKASLTIQSSRPVFNTAYISPVINYIDNDIIFKYVQFQTLDFDDNRVSGADPLISDLTAIFAFYIDIILGMDYDSFSPRGGDVYFQKAQNIINNAPESSNITGWKAFDGTRNRYWLAENLLNSKYTIIHDAIYDYYRSGMDKLYDEEANARTQILNVLSMLNSFNSDNPNTMILPFFLQGKSQELINIFSKANPIDKAKALDLLEKIDVTNTSKYKEGLS